VHVESANNFIFAGILKLSALHAAIHPVFQFVSRKRAECCYYVPANYTQRYPIANCFSANATCE